MASIPVSFEDLQDIASNCARDLLEKWAIEGELEDSSLPEYSLMAADTVAFVIDCFMSYMNATMETRAVDSNII
jgi:hypothetical protein